MSSDFNFRQQHAQRLYSDLRRLLAEASSVAHVAYALADELSFFWSSIDRDNGQAKGFELVSDILQVKGLIGSIEEQLHNTSPDMHHNCHHDQDEASAPPEAQLQ